MVRAFKKALTNFWSEMMNVSIKQLVHLWRVVVKHSKWKQSDINCGVMNLRE